MLVYAPVSPSTAPANAGASAEPMLLKPRPAPATRPVGSTSAAKPSR